MSSSSDLRGLYPTADVYQIGATHFLGDDTEEEASIPTLQQRETRAADNRTAIGGAAVQFYSYSLTAVRLNFDSMTLEIFVDGQVVDWRICDLLPPLPRLGGRQSILVYPGLGDEQELFDREAVLNEFVGKTIRFAPSHTDLFVFWKRDYEIAFCALPIEDQKGWLLHYGPAYTVDAEIVRCGGWKPPLRGRGVRQQAVGLGLGVPAARGKEDGVSV